MSAAQHTPGPWEARASSGSDDFGIIAPDATPGNNGWVCVAECFSDIRRVNEYALQEAAANAQHIVRCVNAHDELLEALQAARPFINAWPQCRDDSTPHIEGAGLLAQIDAAIATATGS